MERTKVLRNEFNSFPWKLRRDPDALSRVATHVENVMMGNAQLPVGLGVVPKLASVSGLNYTFASFASK